MAQFFPDQLSDTTTSEAERRVFDALRTGLDDSYTVLAQLAWLAPHQDGRPREGEADLIIVHPDWGILAIEIKGGIITSDPAGGWASNGQRIKDPIAQGRRAAHEVVDRLGSAPHTRSFKYPFGHAVWFPETDAVGLPPRMDAPDSIVLDAESLANVSDAIGTAFDYWLPDPLPPGPAAEGIKQLVSLLAPTWNLQPLLGAVVRRDAIEYRKLTAQQFDLLRSLGRRPRALVAGSAGSGKTILAMDKARRLAADGFAVLFTCYNRNLALAVGRTLAGSGVDVFTFHELCYLLGREIGLDLPERDVSTMPRSYFMEDLPAALAQATAQLGPRYDAIVVDEAQDFEEVWWIPLLELHRDQAQGILYIFFDNRQDIYERSRAWPIVEEPFELTINCRSTKAIHRVLCEVLPGGLDGVECRGPEGRAPECIILAGNQPERDALRRVLHRLVHDDKVAPGDVVILTPRGRDKSAWSEGDTIGNFQLTWDLQIEAPGCIQVSTIHSFKGLERPIVILTELDHLYRGRESELLYVGRSRASSHLIEIHKEASVAAVELN
jgi:hypothetical protein